LDTAKVLIAHKLFVKAVHEYLPVLSICCSIKHNQRIDGDPISPVHRATGTKRVRISS
jgi:hypothetical protein